MQWHSEITPSMREVLIGWLISIQPKLSLTPHTLYLAVFILDKYCHTKWCSRERYQLLGLAGLFVAAKY
jgi:G2/mitotic-specific cyclin 1/2